MRFLFIGSTKSSTISGIEWEIGKMYVDMWMELLKWLSLDEKYHHPAMEGLAGLFRVSWLFKHHMQYAKVYSMIVVCA